MKCIELTRNQVAIVDDADFERLAQWRWRFGGGYAMRYLPGKKRTAVWMHREINGTPDGFDTDHINGNKLDNRRCNLRTATRSQNKLNQPKSPKNSTGFKNVFFHKGSRTFVAKTVVAGKTHYFGYHDSAEKAHLAYQAAAPRLHGAFFFKN